MWGTSGLCSWHPFFIFSPSAKLYKILELISASMYFSPSLPFPVLSFHSSTAGPSTVIGSLSIPDVLDLHLCPRGVLNISLFHLSGVFLLPCLSSHLCVCSFSSVNAVLGFCLLYVCVVHPLFRSSWWRSCVTQVNLLCFSVLHATSTSHLSILGDRSSLCCFTWGFFQFLTS